MELLGVRDILEMANAVAATRGEPAPYLVEIASPDGTPVRLWGGLSLDGGSRCRRSRPTSTSIPRPTCP